MSAWEERISNHVVWQHMQSLGKVIDQAVSQEDVVPQTIEGLERIRVVLTFVGKRLGGADKQLMYPNSLDAIAGGLQQASVEIEAFVTDGDGNHVAIANSHADTILAGLPAINYPFVADDWIALSEAGRAYRNTLEQSLQHVHAAHSQIQENSANVEQRLLQLGTEIEAERTNLKSVTAEFQSQFSASQEARSKQFAEQVEAALAQIRSEAAGLQQRLSELATEIGTERGRITTVAGEFQSQFSTAQEARNREFSDTQTTRQEKFGNLIADYNQRLTDQSAAFSKQRDESFQQYETTVASLKQTFADSAKAILDQIERHKEAVEKLVGVIGNLGVTSGYLNTANDAKTRTVIWQCTAVAAMLGFILFAYAAFLPVMTGAFSWGSFAGRAFLTLTVGVLAAYAASQGDKYLEIERRNRKLALELEAIGPFISPLPIEMQEEFRRQVGDRTFGREEVALGSKTGKSPATVLDLLKDKENVDAIVNIVVATLKKGTK